MKHIILFCITLLLFIHCTSGQAVSSADSLKIKASLIHDTTNPCIAEGIQSKRIHVNIKLLKSKGYLFENIKFYQASIDYSKPITCEYMAPLYNEYIVAIFPNNYTCLLKGYNKNDFDFFITSLGPQSLASGIQQKEFILYHSVEGLDLLCLFDARKYLNKKTSNLDHAKSFPCLNSCEDPMRTHMYFNKKYMPLPW